MSIILVFLHVIVCIALILIVLLQTGKGADMGAAFGGGSSQTLFGSSGASTFLGKATTVAAVVFMLTSLTLAYRSSHKTGDSIMMNLQQPAPIEQKADAVPAETAPKTETTQASETTPPANTAETVQTTQPADTAQPSAATPETPPAQTTEPKGDTKSQ